MKQISILLFLILSLNGISQEQPKKEEAITWIENTLSDYCQDDTKHLVSIKNDTIFIRENYTSSTGYSFIANYTIPVKNIDNVEVLNLNNGKTFFFVFKGKSNASFLSDRTDSEETTIRRRSDEIAIIKKIELLDKYSSDEIIKVFSYLIE